MTSQELTKIVTDSGIRIAELQKITKVAASTIYRWLKGDVPPKSQLHYNAAMNYIKIIQKATDSGLLPIHKDIRGKERLPVIKAAMRRALEH